MILVRAGAGRLAADDPIKVRSGADRSRPSDKDEFDRGGDERPQGGVNPLFCTRVIKGES